MPIAESRKEAITVAIYKEYGSMDFSIATLSKSFVFLVSKIRSLTTAVAAIIASGNFRRYIFLISIDLVMMLSFKLKTVEAAIKLFKIFNCSSEAFCHAKYFNTGYDRQLNGYIINKPDRMFRQFIFHVIDKRIGIG
jgi:hypothetical protein